MFQKGANLTSEFLYKDNEIIDIEDGDDIFLVYTLNTLFQAEFTLIEEEPKEIDIVNIEELHSYSEDGLDLYSSSDLHNSIHKINELIKAVKQLDRRNK